MKPITAYRLRNWRAELSGMMVLVGVKLANAFGVAAGHGALSVRVFNADGSLKMDYGVVGRRVVTTAGVNFIRDAFLNTTELENMKFHEMGTTNTAEAAGDTALGTAVETRATGSQVSGGTGAYQTVGTITATATRAIVEHGIFSASSAGTLLDRTVFSTVNLASGESIQFTYTVTFSAGG